jgi:hypothetical protein
MKSALWCVAGVCVGAGMTITALWLSRRDPELQAIREEISALLTQQRDTERAIGRIEGAKRKA